MLPLAFFGSALQSQRAANVGSEPDAYFLTTHTYRGTKAKVAISSIKVNGQSEVQQRAK